MDRLVKKILVTCAVLLGTLAGCGSNTQGTDTMIMESSVDRTTAALYTTWADTDDDDKAMICLYYFSDANQAVDRITNVAIGILDRATVNNFLHKECVRYALSVS